MSKNGPIYYWVFFVAHFIAMLEQWRLRNGVGFVLNLAMVGWFQRKMYREIAMHWAIPSGMAVLLFTVTNL